MKTAVAEFGSHWTRHGCSPVRRQTHLPIVIHDCDGEADLLHVLRGDVENNGLVVHRVQSVFLCGCFPLF